MSVVQFFLKLGVKDVDFDDRKNFIIMLTGFEVHTGLNFCV